jgi:hypothetical protein
LKEKIISDFHIPVFSPANGEIVSINANLPIRADLSSILLKQQFYKNTNTLMYGLFFLKKFLLTNLPLKVIS